MDSDTLQRIAHQLAAIELWVWWQAAAVLVSFSSGDFSRIRLIVQSPTTRRSLISRGMHFIIFTSIRSPRFPGPLWRDRRWYGGFGTLCGVVAIERFKRCTSTTV